ncbi:hypothetical protein [Albimonas pacifica]|uniref:Uncharacterized protein n=1 Tax=Albimonas pacifica TaxID=1114924 RepID=A0A1I3GSX6_9RHOB|nr:hypothetical protein [Albimonas pacifica]SFI26547.1 hypothetical protein SAMN05216258_105323 [Albimonas pacifica]
MTILLRCATAAVLATTVPVVGGSGLETWTNVGRLRGLEILVALDQAYLDDDGRHVLVSTRVQGDFDARLDTLPELDAEVAPAPRGVGVWALHLTYVYDCGVGEIADVTFHAAYDHDERRMTAPDDFIDLVVRSHRTGLAAASSPESRDGWRRLCARLQARAPALRS